MWKDPSFRESEHSPPWALVVMVNDRDVGYPGEELEEQKVQKH